MRQVNALGGGFIGRATGNSFVAKAITPVGSTYLQRAGRFTGDDDSKLWTGSFWIKYASDFTGGALYSDNDGDTSITFNGPNMNIKATSSSTTRLLASVTKPAAGQWNHICFSVDMSDTGKRQIIINGSPASVTWSTYSNNVLDFTRTNHTIGASVASGAAADYLAADIAEVYLAFGQYATPAQLAGFRSFDKPSNIGISGSGITGTAPILYLSARDGDAASAFATNRGTGGGMTTVGTLALAATSPSD
jgi:hypothetical protein